MVESFPPSVTGLCSADTHIFNEYVIPDFWEIYVLIFESLVYKLQRKFILQLCKNKTCIYWIVYLLSPIIITTNDNRTNNINSIMWLLKDNLLCRNSFYRCLIRYFNVLIRIKFRYPFSCIWIWAVSVYFKC